jgi:hypothetical protein
MNAEPLNLGGRLNDCSGLFSLLVAEFLRIRLRVSFALPSWKRKPRNGAAALGDEVNKFTFIV